MDVEAGYRLPSVPEAPAHIIDCALQPMLEEEDEIRPEDQIQSRVTRKIVWDPGKVRLHLAPEQYRYGSNGFAGERIKTILQGQPVLPANVLEYLLLHQELIPEEWKHGGKHPLFWGTVFRSSLDGGFRYVRCLILDRVSSTWTWYKMGLDRHPNRDYPAVILVE